MKTLGCALASLALWAACVPVEAPLTLRLDAEEITLRTYDYQTLTATLDPAPEQAPAFTWTSSDTQVATVADGLVTAMGAGEATITVSDGERTATCRVQVKPMLVELFNYGFDAIYRDGQLRLTSAADIYGYARYRSDEYMLIPNHTTKTFNVHKNGTVLSTGTYNSSLYWHGVWGGVAYFDSDQASGPDVLHRVDMKTGTVSSTELEEGVVLYAIAVDGAGLVYCYGERNSNTSLWRITSSGTQVLVANASSAKFSVDAKGHVWTTYKSGDNVVVTKDGKTESSFQAFPNMRSEGVLLFFVGEDRYYAYTDTNGYVRIRKNNEEIFSKYMGYHYGFVDYAVTSTGDWYLSCQYSVADNYVYSTDIIKNGAVLSTQSGLYSDLFLYEF